MARSSTTTPGFWLISRQVRTSSSTRMSTAACSRLEELGVGVERLVGGVDVLDHQQLELVAALVLDDPPVGRIDDGGLDVALQQRRRAHLGARHVGDVAVVDAVALGHQLHDGLGAGAARVDRDLLPVQVLPVLVELGVHHREEAQRAHLVEDADRRLDLLQHRVGGAHADIGLPADHGLGGDVLGLEVGDLDVDAALLGALDRDQEVQRLHGRDVAEGDPDRARGRPRATAAGQRPAVPWRPGRAADAGVRIMTVSSLWRPISVPIRLWFGPSVRSDRACQACSWADFTLARSQPIRRPIGRIGSMIDGETQGVLTQLRAYLAHRGRARRGAPAARAPAGRGARASAAAPCAMPWPTSRPRA